MTKRLCCRLRLFPGILGSKAMNVLVGNCYTLFETYIVPENQWLKDEMSLLGWPILGAYVSFRRDCYSSKIFLRN